MLPSRWRGGDPAAVERTARCRSGGSLSITAAPPPHGGDPKPALAVGAVPDESTGTGVDIHIQDGGRRLHGIPLEVSRPTPADGFDEASVPSLPRHLMRDQMGSGQSPAFCHPVENVLVASAPAGGACGHHGKTPGGLLLLLAATGERPAKASLARSWSQLPPSMVRACFFMLVLFLLCAGGSCTPILKNEFTMEFCPLNTSETCSVPLSHPFKRPVPIHRTWLTEQILETQSVRRMLDEDPKHKCNNSQSLDFQIFSVAAPIISFVANIAPLLNVYGIGQVEETGKRLFATSSIFISASNFFWSWYQYKQECPNGFKITILILSGLVHLVYALFFCISSDMNSMWSFSFLLAGLSASATGIWNKLTSSIFGLICMAIGHIFRVAAIRRYRTANVILACFGLLGIIPVFYRQNWETHVLFTISTLISSGSRIIDVGMQLYYHRRAPKGEDAAHVPPLGHVKPEDLVQGSNQLAVLQGVHDAPIVAIAEGGEDAAHVPPMGQVVPEDIVQGSNHIPVPLGVAPIGAPNVAGEVGDDEAPHDVVIAEGGVSHNCPAGALGVQDIDQEDGNGGAPEVVANAQVAVIQSAPAPAGAPGVEVAATAVADAE